VIEAPAVVFESQHDVLPAFEAGLLDKDCVVVVRHQGPKANGMPELHKLMPPLGVLLDRRFKIALVTDGRLSGAPVKSRQQSMSRLKPMMVGCWRKCAMAM
jgi:phosphogluconate dehydratase